MNINKLDHVVITVNDPESTIDFYTRVLGLELRVFEGGRKALVFGSQKINLHETGRESMPRAKNPQPGSADLCFITETPMAQVISHLTFCNVAVIEGPVAKDGAGGPLLSVYIRDPDGNLIEIANQIRS